MTSTVHPLSMPIVVALALASFACGAASGFPSASSSLPVWEVSSTDAAITHRYLRGVDSLVDRTVRSKARGYRYITGSDVVDDRPTPPPCGTVLAKTFVAEVTTRFGVGGLPACTIRENRVRCPMDYLVPKYPDVFLHLSYDHYVGHIMLTVEARRLSATGHAEGTTLMKADERWLFELFNTLVGNSTCN